jgi:succinyl-CoA synthetase beta subunit
MFLFEHDAKQVLTGFDVPVPDGLWLDAADDPALEQLAAAASGPWMVKAQVAGGGRGKAGGVRRAADRGQARAIAATLLGSMLGGQPVAGCRVECAVSGAHELYLSLALDPTRAEVQVLASDQGGVEVEALGSGALVREWAVLDADAIAAAVERAARQLAPAHQDAVRAAGKRLARAFIELDAQLIEINPLFVLPDGSWLAADAKLITDDNALERRPLLRALVEGAASRYPEVTRKLRHGCDYVVVDPAGEIGLLTTGAGLSMMLIDELRGQGLRPYNFLDVRTGGLRGDPQRLIDVLSWMSEGAGVRVLLVNIFAGITHLGEFSRLLVQALDAVPALDVPVVARLAGPGFDEAVTVLGARGVAVESDLARAIDRVRTVLVEPR